MITRLRSAGFTLIEVAVAMAVVAVSFVALYQSMQGMFSAATLMQEKTFASWVAFDQITELRISGDYPQGDKREGEAELAGMIWLYSMEFDKITEDYQQVIVRVVGNDPDNIIGVATGALLRPAQAGNNGPGNNPQGGGNAANGGTTARKSNSGGDLLPAGNNDGSAAPRSAQPGEPSEEGCPVSAGWNPQRSRGFTLLELLVAMGIFVILAVFMYGGTRTIIQEREFMLDRLEELGDVQRAVRYLQTDFGQLYPRSVRDELGRDRVPALLTDAGNEFVVRLSRDGWRNPAKFKRGTLQRVQYRYDEDEKILYRDYWPVVDRVLGMEAREAEILTGVEEFDIEFLDSNGEWKTNWPEPNEPDTILPIAVRYRFLLESYGEIVRLVEVAG